jgi:predicted RND superfamily exporter protein
VRRPVLLLALAVVVAGIGAYGISRISLENRFVDYFREGSEIREGMRFIDRNLGGTIPLDIVLEFPPHEQEPADAGGSFDDFSMGGADSSGWEERFWFTPSKLRTLERMHGFLDGRFEMGKTVSVSTLEEVARTFNDGDPLSYIQLTAVLEKVPEDVRRDLILPYASPRTGEMRIAGRIHETGPPFSKDALIADIEDFAVDELGFAPEEVHVTGMAVLFNDMLRQLFSSQTSTLAFVIGATLVMFTLLLRSAVLAVLGLLPNLLAAATVLAFMGYAGVPLDMMTITIAAIVIGIGVDDAIHYLHRFREERLAGHDAETAVRNSHRSIGNALYFTSITVVIGFSVLSFSSFVPTLYFGWLTAVAMILALVANLTVLPSLLVLVYGRRAPFDHALQPRTDS